MVHPISSPGRNPLAGRDEALRRPEPLEGNSMQRRLLLAAAIAAPALQPAALTSPARVRDAA
jgi:hypothetical protein